MNFVLCVTADFMAFGRLSWDKVWSYMFEEKKAKGSKSRHQSEIESVLVA